MFTLPLTYITTYDFVLQDVNVDLIFHVALYSLLISINQMRRFKQYGATQDITFRRIMVKGKGNIFSFILASIGTVLGLPSSTDETLFD